MAYYVEDDGIRVEVYDDEFEVHTASDSETVWVFRNGKYVTDCQSEQEAYDWIDETLAEENEND